MLKIIAAVVCFSLSAPLALAGWEVREVTTSGLNIRPEYSSTGGLSWLQGGEQGWVRVGDTSDPETTCTGLEPLVICLGTYEGEELLFTYPNILTVGGREVTFPPIQSGLHGIDREGDIIVFSAILTPALVACPYRFNIRTGELVQLGIEDSWNPQVVGDNYYWEVRTGSFGQTLSHALINGVERTLVLNTAVENGRPTFGGDRIAWSDVNSFQIKEAIWQPESGVADWDQH